MNKNLGSTDKAIRILVAVLIAGLYFTNVISGTVAIVLLALALVFVVTSFISFCPLYYPFGISTRKKILKKLNKNFCIQSFTATEILIFQ
ncbi:MAG: DUF2892 domain-containing protein [Saprospiraceae bacterium]|nr:DUF2892 domain-containing protein [Candidatus Brachybacter algidus]